MRFPPTLHHATSVAQKRSPTRRARDTDLVNDRTAPEIVVLHAGWLDGEVLVWGEMPAVEASGQDKLQAQQTGSAASAPLPYGVSNEVLAHVLVEAAAGLHAQLLQPASIVLWLPTVGSVPLASSPLIASPPDPPTSPTLAPWSTDALRLDRGSILLLLARCADCQTLGPGLLIAEDVRYWVQCMRFATSLVTRQAFLPSVEMLEHTYVARWQPFIVEQDELYLEQLAAAMPGVCRALSHAADEPPAMAPRLIVRDLTAALTDYIVREAADGNTHPPATPQREARGATFDSVHDLWLAALRARDGRMDGDPRALAAFATHFNEWVQALSVGSDPSVRLCFRLEEPALDVAAGGEAVVASAGEWRVEYVLQATDDPSLLVAARDVWRARGRRGAMIQREITAPREKLLAALGRAAAVAPSIAASLRTSEPTGYSLDTTGAYEFLTETAWLLEQAGFGVLLPSWWVRRGRGLKVVAHTRPKGPNMSGNRLSLDTLVDVNWELALGDRQLTHEELNALARLKAPLVRIRGQWVQINAQELQAALEFWKRSDSRQMSLQQVMHTALGTNVAGPASGALHVDRVEADGWIGDLLARLEGRTAPEPLPPPAALHGTLRPYQERGYAWLRFLTEWGLGACLADDMGLGKCITGESVISTVLGPRTLSSLWKTSSAETESDGDGGEWGILAQPSLVNSFDGREIIAQPVRRIYRQRIAEQCVKVRLGDGSHLSSTQRHRYLTPNGWKMAGEIQPGERVAVAAVTPHVGANDMPAELAELMAWQLAEGVEFEQYHRGRFFHSDTRIIERFQDLARRMGIKLREPRPARTTMCMSTNRLYRLFAPWGYEWGHKSADKLVPQSVLEAPLDSQRAFIAALMDAEGHIGKTHCEITMASEQAIFALQLMLRNFGVWGRVRQAMKSATNGRNIKRPYYTLTFGGNSVTRFAEQFQLRITKKQLALEALASLPHNTNVEGIPTQAVVAAMQERGVPLRSVGLRTVYEWQGMGRLLAISVATRLRDKGNADLAQQIDELAAAAIHWCRVKEVSTFQHEGYVYDVEVPTTHNYIANGIVTHNTVQTLALVARDRAEGATAPVLLICPTSVIENWRKETQRFTPDLSVLIHHGPGRHRAADFLQEARQHALVLSSYALLYRDLDLFKGVQWRGLVLDEAQNIKNADTKQARAARSVPADYRIALTGTPVENNIGDLWSLMDFLNPGLVGSQAQFRQHYFVPIQVMRDADAVAQLKRLTGPFMLRRLKTDRTIIADLPEKQEIKDYCTLTREQASLYQAVLKELEEPLDTAEGIQRKGLILATLMKLKQVCNHPAQFLGDHSAIADRSGKLMRLEAMLEEVLAEGDRALIFTQFVAMGEMLKRHLQRKLGAEVLFLHGGTPRLQRTRLVERFQQEAGRPPLFILSLKAGGTGLNLTRASQVFHFDRWWNPAVENQATDRAFRIGQRQHVQVHKFVCAGTLEERIDELIESKREIASQVVGTGEGWLTELSTTQLKELFALRPDAVED